MTNYYEFPNTLQKESLLLQKVNCTHRKDWVINQL